MMDKERMCYAVVILIVLIVVSDGNNKIYTLYATPYENSDHVYLNGLLQTRGNGNDYVLVEKTITFNKVPKIGSTIQASYRY